MQLCFAGAEADGRLGRNPMTDAVAAQHDGAATRRVSGRHTTGKLGVEKDVKSFWECQATGTLTPNGGDHISRAPAVIVREGNSCSGQRTPDMVPCLRS